MRKYSSNYIRALKASRGPENEFLMRLLGNYSRAAALMHFVLAKGGEDDGLLGQAIRNYVINIVSCLETFFRDSFIYCLSADKEVLTRKLAKLKDVKWSPSLVHANLSDDLGFAELVANELKFQNIEEVDSNMSQIFSDKPFLDAIGKTEFPCCVQGKIGTLKLDEYRAEWKKEFAKLFAYRNDFVHDANLPCAISRKEMAGLEASALIICQLTAFAIAMKMKSAAILIASPSNCPALLTVTDLIATDWEIADEGKPVG
jgi:hypothetical protein